MHQVNPMVLTHEDLRLIGIKVSNTTLLRWEQAKRFPRRIRMAGTSVAWLASEIDEWISVRATERAHHYYAECE